MTLYDGRTGEVLSEGPPRPKRFRRTRRVRVFPEAGVSHAETPPSSALIVGRLARRAAGDPARFLRLLMRHLAREIGRRMG